MRKRRLIAIGITLYGLSVLLSCCFIIRSNITDGNLTAVCLSSQFPSADFETDKTAEPTKSETDKGTTDEASKVTAVSENKKTTKPNGKPRVLIMHTHATESYLPTSSGNYHTSSEANTVRDAGNVMSQILEEQGIGVIHNKTLHDDPSYDGSYDRSFNTITAILKKYPSIECIIDLHRDATAAKVDGPTEVVKGKTCAVYSYVLSDGTKTYQGNKAFLSKLNNIARRDFEGFTGEILERPYWYNQELSNKSILIELGNNRNNIKEVRESAKVFAKILAKALS